MGSSQRSRGIRRVVSLNLTQPAGGMAAAVHALACAQPWARRSTGQALLCTAGMGARLNC